jgi:phospholipid transport system substrate-binding protein
MKKFKCSLLFLLATLFCVTTFAQPSPLPMLQSTSDQMLVELQKNEAVLKTKPAVVYGIINKILLPHFDMAGMARSALGRDAWQNASPVQRKQFTQQFVILLTRTYAAAFAQYTSEKVQFINPRGGVTGDNTQIDSQIARPNGQQIVVSYRLAWQNNQWKIYDFSVDGISMVESFRSQFAAQMSQGGLDALIQQLTQHNAQPQSFN